MKFKKHSLWCAYLGGQHSCLLEKGQREIMPGSEKPTQLLRTSEVTDLGGETTTAILLHQHSP